VTGGEGGSASGVLSKAELFDPKTGTFSPTGSMTAERVYHTATLLQDGRVLIVGGENASHGLDRYLTFAELYDPRTGTFSPTGSMTMARAGPAVTLLPDGRVLIAGGTGPGGQRASAELYDPRAGTFSPTGAMTRERGVAMATLLRDGRVLIVGDDSSAELYNPASGEFRATGSLRDVGASNAGLLPDGRVFVLLDRLGEPELYDPGSGGFTDSGLAANRSPCTATVLSDGRVLIAGGMGEDGAHADLYQP
jgi:hypothetical protein